MIVKTTRDIECVPQRELMPPVPAANTKFSSTNDSDFTLYPCVSFLRLSQVDLFSGFHMQTCTNAVAGDCVGFRSSVLVNFLTDSREIDDMDEHCRFECTPGYAAGKTPGLGNVECVPVPVATCTEYQNQYQTQQCEESWF